MLKKKINNIVLTGFMGSGKTTTALFIANNLNISFYDLDQYIESKEGLSISDIFLLKGEPYFRQLEVKYFTEIFNLPNTKIIALGGGAFIHKEIRSLCLQQNSLSFYLELSFQSLSKRIDNDLNTVNRPKAQNKDVLKDLYDERISTYSVAHYTINCEQKKPPEIGGQIIKLISD